MSSISFRLGVNDIFNPESWSTVRTVSQVFIHPSYSSENYYNDIALFKLSVNIIYESFKRFKKKIFFKTKHYFIKLTTEINFLLFKSPIVYNNYIIPVCIPRESASFSGETS